MLSPLHQTALRATADFLSGTENPWWVLGSAAMALIGVDPGEIRDIDVLVSPSDARMLMRTHGLTNQADGGTDRFRSDCFLRPALGALPVEVMSGYQIFERGNWMPVAPASRQAVRIGDATIFVPDRADQITLFQRLGRPKDMDRLQRFD